MNQETDNSKFQGSMVSMTEREFYDGQTAGGGKPVSSAAA
jgi:hypothetical protein